MRYTRPRPVLSYLFTQFGLEIGVREPSSSMHVGSYKMMEKSGLLVSKDVRSTAKVK
jgi:hypothetical protein